MKIIKLFYVGMGRNGKWYDDEKTHRWYEGESNEGDICANCDTAYSAGSVMYIRDGGNEALCSQCVELREPEMIPASLVSAFNEVFHSSPARSGGISSDGPTLVAIAYSDKYGYYHSIDLTEAQVRKALTETRAALSAGIDYLDKQAREA